MQTSVLLFSAVISAVFLYAWKRAFNREMEDRKQQDKKRGEKPRREKAEHERRPTCDCTGAREWRRLINELVRSIKARKVLRNPRFCA